MPRSINYYPYFIVSWGDISIYFILVQILHTKWGQYRLIRVRGSQNVQKFANKPRRHRKRTGHSTELMKYM